MSARKKKRRGSVNSVRDRQLLPRIEAYVTETGDAEMPNVELVVQHLQATHSEYGRKQIRPFTKQVQKAIRFRQSVRQRSREGSLGLQEFLQGGGGPGSGVASGATSVATSAATSGEELSEGEPVDETVVGTNVMNRSMSAIYSRKRKRGDSQPPEGAIKKHRKLLKQLARRARKNARASEPASEEDSSSDDDPAGLGGDNPTMTMTKNNFLTVPQVRLEDVGGLDESIQQLRELIELPLTHPELFAHIGTPPACGILLHGPPGCGKTLLAHAVAGDLQVPFFSVAAPEIVTNLSGDSEAMLRELFANAALHAPCIVFMDQIDAIAPRRATAAREMERRIVAQLLTCMDNLSSSTNERGPVIVIGATSRLESIDSGLRRAGRFERELAIGIPDAYARADILRVLIRKLRVSGDFDVARIAHETPGYVGADLAALTKEAAIIAIARIARMGLSEPNLYVQDTEAPAPMDVDGNVDTNTNAPVAATAATTTTTAATAAPVASPVRGDGDIPNKRREAEEALARRVRVSNALRERPTFTEEELAPLSITMEDFLEALPKVQPSAKREGFATIPDVSWEDVGALGKVRKELEMAILQHIKHPELYERFGVTSPAGVLLFGPPGCGKTLLAKAIANAAGSSFISVKGPELMNKYVGESERAVRQVFARGRASSPCVIFFDEIDALCPKREGQENQHGQRLVNQLLTELDGLNERGQLFIIGATNRPDIIDPAVLRPGRIDKLLYVPLPTPEDRASILCTVARNTPVDPSVDLAQLASSNRCKGFTGADLASLVREASSAALCEIIGDGDDDGIASRARLVSVQSKHFEVAFSKVFPSVDANAERSYDMVSKSLRRARTTKHESE